MKAMKNIISKTLKKVNLYSDDAFYLIFDSGNAEATYLAFEQYGGCPSV